MKRLYVYVWLFSRLFCSCTIILLSSLQTVSAKTVDIENYYSKTLMKNACSKAELSRFHADVISIAGSRSPQQAWRLVEEMLCGTTKASIRYVRANSYDDIIYDDNTKTDDGSVAVAYSYVSSKNLETVMGEAWDAYVYDDDGDIGVGYNMGGVCSGGFDIHFDTKKWKLSKAGIGCD